MELNALDYGVFALYCVAVLAVDPSSPFTGGALLGDRLRMRGVAGDSGVFIRSTASRGALGGLAHTTADMAAAFDVSRFATKATVRKGGEPYRYPPR